MNTMNEWIDTHAMVLVHRAEIEPSDTMIYTLENGTSCLPIPASARRCQTEMRISYWLYELNMT
jgi:hypothetical protein